MSGARTERFRTESVRSLFEAAGIDDVEKDGLKDLISVYHRSVVLEMFADEWPDLGDLKELLRDWYETLVAANGFDIAFPCAGMNGFDKYEIWLDFLCRTDLDISFAYDENEDKFALFWISGRQARTGMLNFTFAQRGGLAKKIESGRWLLDKLFNVCGYESLVGLTPELNRGAIKYAEAIGGEVIAKFPGACYNGHRVETGVLTRFLPKDKASRPASRLTLEAQPDEPGYQLNDGLMAYNKEKSAAACPGGLKGGRNGWWRQSQGTDAGHERNR